VTSVRDADRVIGLLENKGVALTCALIDQQSTTVPLSSARSS